MNDDKFKDLLRKQFVKNKQSIRAETKSDKRTISVTDRTAFKVLESMFDDIIKQILEPIKKDAEKFNDQKVINEINNCYNAVGTCIGFDIANAPLDDIFGLPVEKNIETMREYMTFNKEALNSLMVTSDDLYSEKSFSAMDLIFEALDTFESCLYFQHLQASKTTINMYDISLYSFKLKELIEKVADLSNFQNGKFLKKYRTKRKDEQFLSEINLLIGKNNESVLPACKEYYREHRLKENHEYLKHHYKVNGWEKEAEKKRSQAIKAKYYRLTKKQFEKK